MTPRQIAACLHFVDREEAFAEARTLTTLRISQAKREVVLNYLNILTGES